MNQFIETSSSDRRNYPSYYLKDSYRPKLVEHYDSPFRYSVDRAKFYFRASKYDDGRDYVSFDIDFYTHEATRFFDLSINLGYKDVKYDAIGYYDFIRSGSDRVYLLSYSIGKDGLKDICDAPSIEVSIGYRGLGDEYVFSHTFASDWLQHAEPIGLLQAAKIFYNAVYDDSMYVSEVEQLVAKENEKEEKKAKEEAKEDIIALLLMFLYYALPVILVVAFIAFCFYV